MRRYPFVIAVSALAACLFPDLSTLGGASADGGVDAASDAPSGPTVIANAEQVAGPSGNAQQTHVVWANVSKRWWLFYFDNDTTRMKTRTSPDFVNWQDGASLTLAHTNGGEGRNLSVAYAELGGNDVVHISISHDPGGTPIVHSHTRAVITGAAIAFGAPSDVCSIDSPAGTPDGNATYVAPDGTVWDSTGFVASANTNNMGYQNEDVFRASSKDDGTNWTNAFAQTTVEIVKTASNARAFFNAGGLGALWEAGDQDPDPTNIHFAVLQSDGTWSNADSLFDDSAPQDPNDWGTANLSTPNGGEVHVVRALLAGGYEHAFGSTTTGQNGAAPATQSRTAGTGVVVLADPSHLAAFDVSAGALVESRWNGASWSAWITIAPASTPRTFLSGYCPDLDAHPEAGGCAVIWTTPNTNGSSIAGQLVNVR